MSSPLSDAVEKAAKENAKEASKQIAARLDMALNQLQTAVQDKLEQVIEHDMNDYYYDEYRPIRYHRTDILRNNLVKPLLRPFNNGQEKGFQFGVKWFPENMHHIKIRGPKAKKDPIPVDENLVAENFSKGIHPNGIPTRGTVDQGPIWVMGDEDNTGSAAEIMRQWSKNNLNKIFSEALSDIMKKL